MSSPPLPRPVSPRPRVPPVLLGLVAVLLWGGLVAWTFSRPAEAPATGTAMVVAERNGVQVVTVLDGPEPGRHVVSGADGIATGERFTVSLVGECGCQPYPATLVRTGRSPVRSVLAVVGAGLALTAVAGLALVTNNARSARAAQRRNATVVGTGSGPLVHVLPFWAAPGPVLRAELWPIHGEAPLGQVLLGELGRDFDPSRPFRAWGPLRVGEPIALTSDDGQLVLPRRPLALAAPPGPPDPVTLAIGVLLGWPNRLGPGGEADRATVDAAVERIRAAGRRAGGALAAALVATTVAFALPLPTVVDLAAVAVLAVAALVMVTTVVINDGEQGGPVRHLLAPIVGPGQPRVLRQATQAVLLARSHRPGVPGPSPHGAAPAADGSGWMPPPPLPPPR